MSEASSSPATTKVSSFVIMVVFVLMVLSLAALIFGATILDKYAEAASFLLVLGFLGVVLSAYVLFQTRRRLLKLKIIVPPVTTTVECKKCGSKDVREFQRGDYIFKELGPCQKCNDTMMITAIYKEVKEKEKQAFPV